MNDPEAAKIDRQVRGYLIVFAALLVLTLLTVEIYTLHLGSPTSVVLALLIASLKGSLVAGFFMHLISEKRLIYSLLALTGCFALALIVLTALTFLGRAS